MSSFLTYGAPFAVMGTLRAELDKGATPPPWLLPVATASPSLPSFTWTGFYVGGQMGYGFGDNDGWVSWATAQGQSGQSNLSRGAQGVIGGAHVGYNQQFDRVVLGVEGSVDGATLTKNMLILAPSIVGQALTGGFPVGGNVTARCSPAFRAPFAPARATRSAACCPTSRAASPSAHSRPTLKFSAPTSMA